MHPFARIPSLASLAAAAVMAFSSPLLAETVKLAATLDGAQQNPPVKTDGKGTAQLTFDSQSRKLDWTVEYSGLSGPAVAGHLHGPAEKGENAGVAVPFKGKLASPIKGSATLTEAQASDLLAGRYYINLHTAAHKDGEIRGQVEKAM
ncbi:MAG TPA: CHRD domain-containing protein [Rhizobiaceae bacterium]|nr:CHRD domain-containing protein [Rhizobiaceae bacterium]